VAYPKVHGKRATDKGTPKTVTSTVVKAVLRAPDAPLSLRGYGLHGLPRAADYCALRPRCALPKGGDDTRAEGYLLILRGLSLILNTQQMHCCGVHLAAPGSHTAHRVGMRSGGRTGGTTDTTTKQLIGSGHCVAWGSGGGVASGHGAG
jgi:hypothetical protein